MNFTKNLLRLSALGLMFVLWASCSKDNTDNGGGDNPPPDPGPNPPVESSEVNSDLWTATDPLGRKLPDNEQVGDKRENKLIAMFYWTWHDPGKHNMVEYASIGNVPQILRDYPEALTDAKHPAWDRGGSITHFWGEPLFGYYRTTDPWVLRKHAEMLADAGVDVVFFDCTNAPFLWEMSYNALLKSWDQARKDGVKVPKISFMFPFGPTAPSLDMLRQLYKDLYKPKRYKDLWFEWKGKPMLMAHSSHIPTDNAADRELKNFFTFRAGQPDYVDGPSNNNQWGWLEIYPQKMYALNEEMTVGVAQNTSPERYYHAGAFNVPGSLGRSYMGKTKTNDTRPESYLYGANFQEQWDHALKQDPNIVFVTGWNEFTAGKWDRGTAAGDVWNGDPYSFVDQYDWERSRDIEPNNEWYDANGNYRGDTYYYQLIQNVRKFKGMSKRVYATAAKTIQIGNFTDWADVGPDFRHYKGNTLHRSHKGHANTSYSNTSGRNDIVDAKVARDNDNFYFYVETASNLTSSTGSNWMWLLIDIDRNKATGWEGYDYMINYEKPKADFTGTVSLNDGNQWGWKRAGDFTYAISGKKMEIKIPRVVLGTGSKIDFEFKWVDNMPNKDACSIADFYVYGDAAPGGRFNFIYTVK